ncbi:MAG: HAMP domain-containing protein [Deltaproteobacteria bacterium]|nr:HAMP domain-containing protein [Deltaproteobacteria bacterium]MCW5802568.1 HAMP domain-containing protein [Deltaproteobacteria bacterium]
MRLRGRFTLTLALAALVPISVAAVVTQQVVSRSRRQDYAKLQTTVRSTIEAEIDRLRQGVRAVSESFASDNPDHQQPLVGYLIREVAKKTLTVPNDCAPRGPLYSAGQQAKSVMRALSLDTLTITGPNPKLGHERDYILLAQHNRGAEGALDPKLREDAEGTRGEPYFAFDEIFREPDTAGELVAKSTMSSKQMSVITVSVARKVTDAIFAGVRNEIVDARVVRANPKPGAEPVVASKKAFTSEPVVRIPLLGADKQPVAFIEITVSDEDLDAVLRQLTYFAAALALAALGVVVLIGMLVARRTARDLDALVVGSLAASRGDLEHRVPVRSDDEIGAVASAFNFMMEDLRTSKERLVIAERIAAWQDIARRLAHEIKNPLTPIQMAMDTLRKTWKKQHPSFDEILEESTTTVLQEADRLKHLVAEFSDFARMPKPEFQRIDLNEAVRSAVSLYQGAVPVETRLAAPLPQLDADKNQLNQVLINLVENARDAIGKRPDGKITVSTRLGEAGDRAMLYVDDNGAGVPTDLKEKVFAPYFTTKHAKGGTGLGLAIVHRIVSDHGGRIAVSDAPGGGARFAIELPLRNGTALLASRI